MSDCDYYVYVKSEERMKTWKNRSLPTLKERDFYSESSTDANDFARKASSENKDVEVWVFRLGETGMTRDMTLFVNGVEVHSPARGRWSAWQFHQCDLRYKYSGSHPGKINITGEDEESREARIAHDSWYQSEDP